MLTPEEVKHKRALLAEMEIMISMGHQVVIQEGSHPRDVVEIATELMLGWVAYEKQLLSAYPKDPEGA